MVFPKPIVTMADASALRVRAEVDERDIGRVSIGGTARIISDAFPGKIIEGKVSRMEGLMGRKKVRTGDPAEKSTAMCWRCLLTSNLETIRWLLGYV
jgi:HlyD family secretion protein